MRRPWKLSFWLVFAVAVLASALFKIPAAGATNPSTIAFQGKVVNSDGTNVTDGSYSFVFKLYTVSSGGSAIWTETDSSVTVTSGIFQVQLGNGCPFFTANTCNGSTPIDFNANPNLYLGITFNSDPAGEMTPRVQLQSVPFAYNADKVGGLSVSQLVQLSPGSQQSGNISVNGNGTFGNGLNITGSTVLNGGVTLGSTTTAASLLFQDGTANNYAVTLNAAALGASYNLTLPTSAPSTSQCLKSGATTASQLTFASCDIGGEAFLANNQTFTGTNTFTGSGNGTAYGTVFQNASNSTTAFAIQRASGRNLFAVDSLNQLVTVSTRDMVLYSAPTAGTYPGSPAVVAGSNTGGSLSGSAATTYYYEVTAITGSGESDPSAEVSINGSSFTPISAPSTAPTSAQTNGSGLTGTYCYKYTYVTADGETTASTASNCTTISNKRMNVTGITAGPTGTTARNLYRTTNGGSTYYLDTTISGNTTTTYTDSLADGSLGAVEPSSNTGRLDTNNATISFTSVTGATSYLVYRGTASGGESSYQTTSASPFTDTGASGTAGTPPTNTLVAHFGINTTSPSDSLDVVGTSTFSGATAIDNPGASALAAGLSFTNTGGGGYTDLINSSNFILAGSGDIYGKGLDYFDPSALTGAVGSLGLGSGGASGGNFGGALSTGAVIGNTDSYAQEFVASKASTTLNNTAVGDDGKWYFNNGGNLTVSFSNISTTGGYARLTMGTTSARGGLITEGATAGTIDAPLNAANLPIIQMKVRPSVLTATDDLVFGAMDTATAPTANDTLPANGFVFWTDNGTGSTGWQGVVRSGSATVGTVTCPGAATTGFAVGRIVVVNSTTVRFFIDTSAASGVNFVDCGTVTGTLPTANLAMGMYDVHTTTTSTTFDMDYARFWQDDSPVAAPNAGTTVSNEVTQADLSAANDNAASGPAPTSNASDTSGLSSTTDTSPTLSDLQTTPINANTVGLSDRTGKVDFQFDASGNASLNGSLSIGAATLSGGLTVGGDATFGGLSTFQKLATFLAKTVFRQDVEFDGHINVSSDTAGYATIKSGDTKVHVSFTNPYDTPPVVTVNVTDGQFQTLTTNNISATGFDILIPASLNSDLHLSWTAIGVINPQTQTSSATTNQPPLN